MDDDSALKYMPHYAHARVKACGEVDRVQRDVIARIDFAVALEGAYYSYKNHISKLMLLID